MASMSMEQIWQLQDEERQLYRLRADITNDIKRARINAQRVGALKHKAKWALLATKLQEDLAREAIDERVKEIHRKLLGSWVEGGKDHSGEAPAGEADIR